MSDLQQKKLTPKENYVLDRKLKDYREELLVKQYIMETTPPDPVSKQMIKDYYKNNPEKFGGKKERQYEMISSKRKLKSYEQETLLRILKDADKKSNWIKWSKDLNKKGYPIAYRTGKVSKSLLDPKIYKLMKTLEKGKTSDLIFINGLSYIVKIAEETQIPPLPFEEVSESIRKSLVPIQLKKSLQEASKKVMEDASVQYESWAAE